MSTCTWAWRSWSWHGANGCPTTGGCYTPPSNRGLAFRSSRILFIRSSLGRRAKGLDRRVDLSEAAVGDLDLAHRVLLPVRVGLRLVLGVEGDGGCGGKGGGVGGDVRHLVFHGVDGDGQDGTSNR